MKRPDPATVREGDHVTCELCEGPEDACWDDLLDAWLCNKCDNVELQVALDEGEIKLRYCGNNTWEGYRVLPTEG